MRFRPENARLSRGASRRAESRSITMPLPLLALAVAAFGIGTTEFVIMGLLPDVARDLSVSIPAAGMLVSAYALGVTIGAPIVAIAVANMPRKKALMSLIGVFIVGNLLCAIAPGYAVLMAARIVTAFCHGAFFGIGSVVAAGLVAPNRRAQAIAREAGPFGTVPANVQAKLVKAGYNRLAFIQTFTFGRDGTLETKLVDR